MLNDLFVAAFSASSSLMPWFKVVRFSLVSAAAMVMEAALPVSNHLRHIAMQFNQTINLRCATITFAFPNKTVHLQIECFVPVTAAMAATYDQQQLLFIMFERRAFYHMFRKKTQRK